MLRFFQRLALRLLVRFTLVLPAIWYALHTLGSSYESSDLQHRLGRVLLLLIFCGAILILVSLLGKAAARRGN